MIKCTFTSVWDDGSQIMTPCKYDAKTGEIFPETTDFCPKGSLVREYITLPDGSDLEVCTVCHEFVMKKVMGIPVCSDPNCDS